MAVPLFLCNMMTHQRSLHKSGPAVSMLLAYSPAPVPQPMHLFHCCRANDSSARRAGTCKHSLYAAAWCTESNADQARASDAARQHTRTCSALYYGENHAYSVQSPDCCLAPQLSSVATITICSSCMHAL